MKRFERLLVSLASLTLTATPAVAGLESTAIPTRPSDRPLISPKQSSDDPAMDFRLPDVPTTDAGEGARDKTLRQIKVDSVVFEGNHNISTQELLQIAQPFIGKLLLATEIEDLRYHITKYYVSKGYVNSGALLNANSYQNGILTFRIIEGKLEDIRISGTQRLRPEYVSDRLSTKGQVLNINVLQENFRLLLADPLFSKVTARVLPGTALGDAILDVDVTRARPYQLTLFSNNHHSPSSGSTAYGATGSLQNLTGFGDVLDATYEEGKANSRHGIGWSAPLTHNNLRFNARYDEGDSTLIEEPFQSIDIKSKFKSKEFGLKQPIINRLQQQLSLGISWSARESMTTLLGVPFSFTPGEIEGHTKVNVWRFTQDYMRRGEQNVFVARSSFSKGLNNIEQDQTTPNIPQRSYLVWLGQYQYAQRVMDNDARIISRGVIQKTSHTLVPLERISIGGASTVRGYRENQLVRDQGYIINVEFSYPLTNSKASDRSINSIIFYDHGAARNQNESTDRLSSIGIGFNGQYKGFSGELYFAHRLKKLSGDEGSDLQDKGIHFQIRYDLF